MSTKTVSLAEYCEPRGVQAWLARELGVTAQEVGRWVSGARLVPIHTCHRIEEVTRGQVPCELLRPDLVWLRVRDRERKWKWHSKGRPTLEVTKSAPPGGTHVDGAPA